MISRKDLRKMARAKLKDAEVLSAAKRYDAAVYLCGYVVECALKARIIKTLHWIGFPETNKEFDRFKSFKTHDLKTLLALSGQSARILAVYVVDWTVVVKWDPEDRYKPVGAFTQLNASSMIQSSRRLLTAL